MKTIRIIAAAALVVAGALAPHLAQAQWPGIKRTDVTRDDLSVPGREVIGTPHAVKNVGSGMSSPRRRGSSSGTT